VSLSGDLRGISSREDAKAAKDRVFGFVEIITFPDASVIHSLFPIFAPAVLTSDPGVRLSWIGGGEAERSISR
jgi:hypothetical protein